MRAFIYLNEIKFENLLAEVELEVVPRGIYQIGGKKYQYTGQPEFVIVKSQFRGDPHKLDRVELVVEEYLHVVGVKENLI